MDTKPKKKRFYRSPQRKSDTTRQGGTVPQIARTLQGTPQSPTAPTWAIKDPQYESDMPPAFNRNPSPATQQPLTTQTAASAPTQQPTTTADQRSLTDQSYNPNALFEAMQNSPIIWKIKQNEEKIRQLREIPVKDKNGFWTSFAKAGLMGLAQAFNPANPIRNDGDFFNRLASVGGSAIGGGVNKKWDEHADIQAQIARTTEENDDLTKQAKQEFDMQQKAANYGLQTQKAENQATLGQGRLDIQRSQLDERVSQNQFRRMDAQKQQKIDAIFKRGYYYEGDHPEEDAELQQMNVVLPDFDTTRKPITDNGVRKTWNTQSKTYEPTQGSDIDPDEEPVTFMVDGERITASRKHFLNYKAAKERSDQGMQWNQAKLGYESDQYLARLKGELASAQAEYDKATSDVADITQAINAGEVNPTDGEKRRTELLDIQRKAQAKITENETRIKEQPNVPKIPEVKVGVPNQKVGTATDYKYWLNKLKK